ncbi:MAG: hypothetical protein ACYDH6_16035 [Acidimicrobiales bacterium]
MVTETVTNGAAVTAASQYGTVQGRLLIGRFLGIEPKTKKDGTVIRGLFEVLVGQDMHDREWTHRATFFTTDPDGDLSKMQKSVDGCNAQPGDMVAVRFGSTASLVGDKVYVNDTAVGISIVGL